MAGDRFQVIDGREHPWFRIHNEIIDVYGGKMGPNCLAIYCALSRHANQKDECWPSHALLAQETGMSVTSVKKAIKRLIELKLIKKEVRRYAKSGPRSSIYTLLEIPGHRRDTPMPQAGHAHALSRQPATNKTNRKNTDRKTYNTKASLEPRIKVLREFGIRGSIVMEIAENHDLDWIQKAMEEMDIPSPGGVVYLHREGWDPEYSADADGEPIIVCSVCGYLEEICMCSDPKPKRITGPEFARPEQEYGLVS